jgi:hypothetical protein
MADAAKPAPPLMVGAIGGPVPGADFFVAAPPPVVVPGEMVPDAGCAGKTLSVSLNLIDWCDDGAIDQVGAQNVIPPDCSSWVFRRLAGFHPAAGGKLATFPLWACAIFGAKPGYWASIVIGMVYVVMDIADGALGFVVPSVCGTSTMAPLYAASSIMGIAERWIGTDFGPARQSLTNHLNFACPQTPQGPAEVIPAYLHGLMQQSEAQDWCQVVGWCPRKTELAIDAARWRPSPADIVTWRNWQCLSGMTTADAELRKLGMTESDDRTAYLCASYTPLGVGEIYRLLHLCRAGAPPGRPSYTQDDATRDLRKLGYSEADIPRIIFLARTDLGHRQLLQPYLEGAISDRVMQSYLLDDGYDQDDITRLMPYYQHARVQYVDREVGVPSVAEVSKAMARGTTAPDQWATIVQLWDVSPLLYDSAGKVVEYERQAAIREAGIGTVKAAFDAGETDAGVALTALAEYGISGAPASDLVQVWALGQSIRRKPAGPAQLCQWYTSGLLSTAEYSARMLALHYSASDVARIISLCADAARRKIEASAAKEAALAQKKAAAEATAEGKAKAAALKAARQAGLAAARAALAQQRAEVAAIRGDLRAASGVTGHVHTRETAQLAGKLTGHPGPPAEAVTAPAAPPSVVAPPP